MGFKVWRVGVGPFGGLRFTIRGLGPLSFGIYCAGLWIYCAGLSLQDLWVQDQRT